jgi:enoyl-CoA hydratase/carnithine racemase
MWRQLADIFEHLETEPDVRVIVLTGAGGTFCSGADIREFSETRATPEQAEIYAEAGHNAQHAIFQISKPVIAAIAGHCVGGGFGLAVCCDFRVAERPAKLGITAAKMGITYGIQETQCLLAIAGLSVAKRILFGGELFTAPTMRQMGLVDELVEGDAIGAARTLAERLARNAPLSIAGSKLILNGLATGLGSLDLRRADAAAHAAVASEDYAEAVRAFTNRTSPAFKGR